jgi:hypothetical protein
MRGGCIDTGTDDIDDTGIVDTGTDDIDIGIAGMN